MKFNYTFAGLLLALNYAPTLCLAQEHPLTSSSKLDLGGGVIVVPKYYGATQYLLVPYPTISYSWNRIISLSLVEGLKIKYSALPYVSFMVTANHSGKMSDGDIGPKPGIWKSTASASYKAPYVSPMIRIAEELTDNFSQAGTYTEIGLAKNIYSIPLLFIRFELMAQYSDTKRLQRLFGVTRNIAIAKNLPETAYTSGGFESLNASYDAEYEFLPSWFLQSTLNYRYLLGSTNKSPVIKTHLAKNQIIFAIGAAYRFEL